MKKIFLVLTCLVSLVTFCGCTHVPSALEVNDISEYTICVDGIEYIKYSSGYAGYMSPHLRADENSNPKVIRCTR